MADTWDEQSVWLQQNGVRMTTHKSANGNSVASDKRDVKMEALKFTGGSEAYGHRVW